MNKFFKFTISSLFTMILFVILAVALTGNTKTGEKSAYGKNVVDSQGATIYIQPANITFCMPSGSERYFKDTSNKGVANYMEKQGAIFVAGFSDEPFEMSVKVNTVEILENIDADKETADKEAFEKLFFDNNTLEISDFKNLGITKVDDISFYHLAYTYFDSTYKEYNLISEYIGIVDGKSVDFSFMYYSGQIVNIDVELDKLDSFFEEIFESVRYGDFAANSNSSGDDILSGILQFSFYPGILFIPLLFILFSNTTVASKYGYFHDDAYSQRHTKEILGFFALCIVLHHLVQQIGNDNAGILSIFEGAGVCFVGVFFFYSGYGLMKSYYSKNNYLRGFLLKRLPSILIPFYTAIFIFLFDYLIFSENHDIVLFIKYITGISLINGHMWYIVEIAILYVVFWLSFTICKKERNSLIVIFTVSLIITGFGLVIGHGDNWFQGEWWYNTTLLFVIGMIFSKHEDITVRFVRKYYSKILPLATVLFIILNSFCNKILNKYGYWTEYYGKTLTESYSDKIKTLVVQEIMVISFVFLLVVVSQKIHFSNRVLSYLGKISLELYLIHNLFLQKLSFISGTGVYLVLVILLSVISAGILHILNDRVLCLIYRSEPEKLCINVSSLKLYLKNEINRMLISIGNALKHPKKVAKMTLRQMVCLILVFISIFPVYTMIINSTQAGTILEPVFLPGKHFLQNLREIEAEFHGTNGSIYAGIINSCLIAFPSSFIGTYISALTAYAFSRYEFKGRKILWYVVIICMLMPASAGLIGMYQILAGLHLLNNYIPVILISLANPSAVYFINMYLQNINLTEIGEAARIDGAGELMIFNKIIMPVIRPVLALQITFSFVNCWNNGYLQSLLLWDWNKKTVSAYISIFSGGNGAGLDPHSYALVFACTMIPMIVYILCSKSIVSSITLGAVKE